MIAIMMQLFRPCLAVVASGVLGAVLTPALAQSNDMFASRSDAEKRAKQLHCAGSFAMANEWMPCQSFAAYEQALKSKK